LTNATGKYIAVIGAGSWGTALAIIAAKAGHSVRLWSRNTEVVQSINQQRVNPVYLSGTHIPERVLATTEIATALEGAGTVITALPSHATRMIFTEMKSALEPNAIMVSATKGIEIETGKRISQIAVEVLDQDVSVRFVCLSGPSFAKEVVDKHPTAIVAASEDLQLSRSVQTDLSVDNLRIYASNDVVGTELSGSVKNVMAIAAGMVAGLGLGANSVAALITRGLAEIARLVLCQGGRLETLMGLAGLGDLVLTCTGTLSRNRFVGQELGKGRSLDEITRGMNEVAEGINTTKAVTRLASRLGVEMPITNEVHAVLYEGKPVRDAAASLMSRPLRDEYLHTEG
jgi:glycerol-3-phosphate dehydrogenase (NAD(P)+)